MRSFRIFNLYVTLLYLLIVTIILVTHLMLCNTWQLHASCYLIMPVDNYHPIFTSHAVHSLLRTVGVCNANMTAGTCTFAGTRGMAYNQSLSSPPNQSLDLGGTN